MKDRVIELRKYMKLSQQQFAEQINLSRNFINLFENGNKQFSDRTISDICRVFNVNETWLRTGEGNMFDELSREQEIADITAKLFKEDDPFRIEMVKLLVQLTPEEVETLKKMAIMLAEKAKESQ